VLICTNLMHRVADDVQAAIDIPLLHIADALADRAGASGWPRLGVPGARWVMEEDFYVGPLARVGLTVDIPGEGDRTSTRRWRFENIARSVSQLRHRASSGSRVGPGNVGARTRTVRMASVTQNHLGSSRRDTNDGRVGLHTPTTSSQKAECRGWHPFGGAGPGWGCGFGPGRLEELTQLDRVDRLGHRDDVASRKLVATYR
jgi:hypothetical protein